MSKPTVEELAAYMDETEANMAATAAHFGVSKATVRNLLHTPGPHLGDHPPSKLSERDYATYDVIKTFIVEHGWAPTVREVAALVSGTVNPVHHTFHKLAAHGLIEITGQPRAMRVVGSVVDMSGVAK